MKTKEISIIDQVEDLSKKSGTPFEFNVQELIDLGERAKNIENFQDPNFKEVKAEMVQRRNYIKQYCLDARREIKKVAEGVSEIEKHLYELFVPEEDRLSELAKVAKEEKERLDRLQMLPRWKEELTAIGDGEEVSDDILLKMTAEAFVSYKNNRITAKIEADRAEIERVRAEQEKEKKRLEWEAGAQEREAKAREDEKLRQAEEDRERKEKITKIRINNLLNFGLVKNATTGVIEMGPDQMFVENKFKIEEVEVEEMSDEKWSDFIKQVTIDFERRKRAAADAQEAKEENEKKAKRERAEKYKSFRANLGYSEENHSDYYEKVITENGVDIKVILFKKCGEFDLTSL